jgi:hypothetical protein
MATPNLSEIATTTLERRSKKIRDNVSNNNALLFKLQEKAEQPVSGGRLLYEEISFAENGNGQWYTGYDTLSTTAQDVLTSAEYNWKQYAVAVTMSGLEELQNSGEEEVINLLGARIAVAEATMANAIEDGLYSDGTANGGKIITGLDAAVPQDPTTGTYGGINRATASNAFWRSQLYDPSSTPTASTIQGYMTTLWASCVRGKDSPNLIMSGGTIWQTFMASLQTNQRFTDPKLAAAGFQNVMFMTAPVVLSGGIGGQATATDMYFLNTNYLHWRPHSRRNMVPIGKRRFATNQDAVVEILGFAGNLTCSGAKFQGRLKGD